MGVLSKLFAVGALSLGLLTSAACGGAPDDAPPAPLARHFDDMFIADVAMNQRQAAIDSQNEWAIARMENAKAEADHNEATAQITVVRNDLKAARLAVDSAVSNKKQAEASADNNRINQATKDLHAAEQAAKAAELRLKYHEAYRAWLKRHLRLTQENMYWREAKYELAKSQIAQRNNKSPRGVDYNWFPAQEAERAKRVQTAKAKADAERQKALAARDAWLQQQRIADRENGRTNSLPDPMAPAAISPPQGTFSDTSAPAPAPPAPPAPAAYEAVPAAAPAPATPDPAQ